MKKQTWFLCMLLLMMMLTRPISSISQAVNVGDSMALVDLYNSTNGPKWTRFTNWFQGPLKKWDGVTLTKDGLRVKELNLFFSNLDGELPPSLGNLTSCDFFYLAANSLKGKIPESFGNLVSVQRMWFEDNQLSGQIPAGLGNLPNLYYLDLTQNKLSGKIPETLANMPNLTSLHLDRNKFTFDGMEKLVERHIPNFSATTQDTILQIGHKGNMLFVSAGGSLKNNTYTWQNSIGADTTIRGDSTFTPKTSGYYTAVIRNSIVTNFYLNSIQLFASPIVVVDPYPGMITTNGLISTNLSNIDYSKTVNKAATDGLTKLLLTSNSNTPITFTIDGDNNGTLSSLTNQSIRSKQVTIIPDANGRIVAIYTVPDGYGLSSPAGERTCSIKINSTNNINNNTTVDIKLVTPPVVLVHGMWSDPSVWEKGGFTTALGSAGIKNVYLADYRRYSSVTFDPYSPESFPARLQLLAKIYEGLNDYRSHGIAVSQVDIVGHSLGGLITRSLSQQSMFLADQNYYKGFVHKLITMGTPHRGSPFGPELYNQKDTWSYIHLPGNDFSVPYKLSFLLELLGMPIGSCHRDFGITSQGIVDLSNTLPFKTFAITATHEGDGIIPGEISSYLAMEGLCLFAFGKPLEQVMQSRCNTGMLPNDLIVPYRSQTGYIGSTALFYETSHSVPGLLTETNNPLIQLRVSELLLSNDTTEFSKGFPAPSGFPLESCDNATEKIGIKEVSKNGLVNGTTSSGKEYVQISSPLKGSVYRQGLDTLITIGYKTFGGALPTNAQLVIQNVGWYRLPTTPPYSIIITLPRNTQTGDLNIALLVNDTTGVRLFDTSHITLLPNGSLSRIAVQPSFLYLDSINRQTKILIREEYTSPSGTQVVDISSSLEGVTYTTQKNESIVKISGNGTVNAVNIGTDTIIAAFGDSIFKVPVTVNGNFSNGTLYQNTISFTVIPDKTKSDGPFTLVATATSGENVDFSILAGPARISNGIVFIEGTGTVTVQATSGGNPYFSTAIPVTRTFNVSEPLPLQILTFTGTSMNGSVILDWTTSGEVNTSYFTIERSLDGINFTKIGKLQAAGIDIGLRDYNFKDVTIASIMVSHVYYRLKETDKDGKETSSGIISIALNIAKDVVVYPNPAKNEIWLLLNKPLEGNNYLKLVDMAGKVVVYQKLTSSLSQHLYLSNLADGNYTTVILNNDKIFYKQILSIIK